ncbi:MAG: TetR/AcrR family transcriptional regulator [Hyphomicrobiales bacterium]
MTIHLRDRRLDRQQDKRTHILDAAERCFARSGFHRTTMQDVAREAGMVPGNLYRYFPSKDAMIAGLAERDRLEIAADFASLSDAPDFLEAFKALGRKYFLEEPRERAIIALEIWAESSRNPDMAEMRAFIHEDVHSGICRICSEAQKSGAVHSDIDISAVARLIMMLSDALTKRRAIDPDFVAERDVQCVIELIGAMLGGACIRNPNSPTSSTLTTGKKS